MLSLADYKVATLLAESSKLKHMYIHTYTQAYLRLSSTTKLDKCCNLQVLLQLLITFALTPPPSPTHTHMLMPGKTQPNSLYPALALTQSQ